MSSKEKTVAPKSAGQS
ncbi:hypothetical protein SpCBS45565_g03082 [Spizellomyces sp. 'palustris']|nr:hypothetical protein SpCBS45565_g03082 [Spizellomyces sp. 'palustris']